MWTIAESAFFMFSKSALSKFLKKENALFVQVLSLHGHVSDLMSTSSFFQVTKDLFI